MGKKVPEGESPGISIPHVGEVDEVLEKGLPCGHPLSIPVVEQVHDRLDRRLDVHRRDLRRELVLGDLPPKERADPCPSRMSCMIVEVKEALEAISGAKSARLQAARMRSVSAW